MARSYLAFLLCLALPLVAFSEEEDMTEMAFGMVDSNGNGKITKKETRTFLNGMGAMFLGEGLAAMSKKDKKALIDEVFLKLDKDGDKKINKAEASSGAGFVKEMVERIQMWLKTPDEEDAQEELEEEEFLRRQEEEEYARQTKHDVSAEVEEMQKSLEELNRRKREATAAEDFLLSKTLKLEISELHQKILVQEESEAYGAMSDENKKILQSEDDELGWDDESKRVVAEFESMEDMDDLDMAEKYGEPEQLVKELDSDKDGKISPDEFVAAATIEENEGKKDEKRKWPSLMLDAFEEVKFEKERRSSFMTYFGEADADEDGFVGVTEVKGLLRILQKFKPNQTGNESEWQSELAGEASKKEGENEDKKEKKKKKSKKSKKSKKKDKSSSLSSRSSSKSEEL